MSLAVIHCASIQSCRQSSWRQGSQKIRGGPRGASSVIADEINIIVAEKSTDVWSRIEPTCTVWAAWRGALQKMSLASEASVEGLAQVKQLLGLADLNSAGHGRTEVNIVNELKCTT